MFGKSHWFLKIGLLIAAAIIVSGCSKVSGGGWFRSSNGSGKVTFAFHGNCDSNTGSAKGKLEYHDKAANVHLHGEAVFPVLFCTGQPEEGLVTYAGTYRPQPTKRGSGGEFVVVVHDGGEPGPSNGDYFEIELIDGIYDGYSNAGVLEGGNIQFH